MSTNEQSEAENSFLAEARASLNAGIQSNVHSALQKHRFAQYEAEAAAQREAIETLSTHLAEIRLSYRALLENHGEQADTDTVKEVKEERFSSECPAAPPPLSLENETQALEWGSHVVALQRLLMDAQDSFRNFWNQKPTTKAEPCATADLSPETATQSQQVPPPTPEVSTNASLEAASRSTEIDFAPQRVERAMQTVEQWPQGTLQPETTEVTSTIVGAPSWYAAALMEAEKEMLRLANEAEAASRWKARAVAAENTIEELRIMVQYLKAQNGKTSSPYNENTEERIKKAARHQSITSLSKNDAARPTELYDTSELTIKLRPRDREQSQNQRCGRTRAPLPIPILDTAELITAAGSPHGGDGKRRRDDAAAADSWFMRPLHAVDARSVGGVLENAAVCERRRYAQTADKATQCDMMEQLPLRLDELGRTPTRDETGSSVEADDGGPAVVACATEMETLVEATLQLAEWLPRVATNVAAPRVTFLVPLMGAAVRAFLQRSAEGVDAAVSVAEIAAERDEWASIAHALLEDKEHAQALQLGVESINRALRDAMGRVAGSSGALAVEGDAERRCRTAYLDGLLPLVKVVERSSSLHADVATFLRTPGAAVALARWNASGLEGSVGTAAPLAEARQALAEERARHDTLRLELHEAKQRLAEQCDAVWSAEQRARDSSRTCAALEEERTRLVERSAVEALEARYEVLASNRDAAVQAVDELTKQKASVEEELDVLRRAVAQERETWRLEHSMMRGSIESLRRWQDESNTMNAVLAGRLQDSQRDVGAMREAADALREEARTLRQEQLQAAALAGGASLLSYLNVDREDRDGALYSQLVELVQSLTRRVQAQVRTIDEQAAQRETTEAALTAVQGELEDTREDLVRLSCAATEAEQRFSTTTASLRAETERLGLRVEHLTHQLGCAEEEQERSAARERAWEEKARVLATLPAAERLHRHGVSSAMSYEEQLKALEQRLLAHDESEAQWSATHASQQRQLKHLERMAAEANDAAAALRQRVETQEQSLTAAAAREVRLWRNDADAADVLHKTEQELRDAQATCQQAQCERAALLRDNVQLLQHVDTLNNRTDQLQAMVQSLEQRLGAVEPQRPRRHTGNAAGSISSMLHSG